MELCGSAPYSFSSTGCQRLHSKLPRKRCVLWGRPSITSRHSQRRLKEISLDHRLLRLPMILWMPARYPLETQDPFLSTGTGFRPRLQPEESFEGPFESLKISVMILENYLLILAAMVVCRLAEILRNPERGKQARNFLHRLP